MRRFLILILLISFSKISLGQKDEIDDFFSQFGNGFYKDLTKEKFFLVDSIINLNYLDFKQLNKTDTTLTEEDIDFISENLKNKTAQIWTSQTFDSAKIKSKRKLLSIVRKTTTRIKSIAYFELSLPYFNRN